MVRDQGHNKTLEQIWQQYQVNEENDQFISNRGRGHIHHADCHFTQRLLKKKQNEDWEDTREMQETTAAKEENRATMASMYIPVYCDRLTLLHTPAPALNTC